MGKFVSFRRLLARRIESKPLLISIIVASLLPIVGCQEAIESTIRTPEINLYVNVDGLSSIGLDLNVEASITNLNPVSLDVGDLQLVAKGETSRIYLQDTIMGGSIAPNSSRAFSYDFTIPIDVLNERNITVAANTRVGAAGIELPFGTSVNVQIPELNSLISIPQPNVTISTPKLRLPPNPPSIEVPIKTIITNTNSVELILGDLHINLYKSGSQLIKTDTAPGGSIPASGTQTFEHSIILGLELLDIIGSSSVTVKVNTEVGISGIDEMLPIQGQFTLELPPFPPWS